MDVTVAHLRNFLAVADALHFFQAAEARRVSPSSLSEGLIDPRMFLSRSAAHAADLDVVQVGPPPTRGRAVDL